MPDNRHLSARNASQNERLRRSVRELQDAREAFIETAEDSLAKAIASIEAEAGGVFTIYFVDVEHINVTQMEDRTPRAALGRVKVSIRPLI